MSENGAPKKKNTHRVKWFSLCFHYVFTMFPGILDGFSLVKCPTTPATCWSNPSCSSPANATGRFVDVASIPGWIYPCFRGFHNKWFCFCKLFWLFNIYSHGKSPFFIGLQMIYHLVMTFTVRHGTSPCYFHR